MRIQIGGSTTVASIHEPTGTDERVTLWPSVSEYQIYDEPLYELMSSDSTRNAAYVAAVRRLAPGRVCLDIGTGAHVNWARACVEAGARKVYAIEAIEESYVKAVRTVRDLGMEERIHVVHGLSTEVTLPEPIDLCVSEIIGCIGSSEGAVSYLLDVRRRLLREGGLTIPRRCLTWIAGVSLPESLRSTPGFDPEGARYLEPLFHKIGKPFDVRLLLAGSGSEDLLSDAVLFEDVDFGALAHESTTRGTSRITTAGRLDGFLAWIELWCDDVGPPVSSLGEWAAWVPVFFPVFSPGIDVDQGDWIELTCRVRSSSDHVHPDYHLEGRVVRGAGGGAAIPFRFDSMYRGGAFRESAYYRSLFSG